jgi:GT2 family glycosyltransferase
VNTNQNDIAVTAIVVTYNSEENIIECLNALKDEVASVGGEILIVDNCSKDDTAKLIREKYGDLELIIPEKNLGFGPANNLAAKKARGEFVLFANPDMVLDKGTLSKLMDNYRRLEGAGAVVARLRNPDGSFQPTCRNFPNFYNIFFSRGSVLNPDRWGGRNNYTIGEFNEVTEVPAASAACMLTERDFFLKIGGFDPRFFLFMEDTDLSLRINQSKRKIYFIPEAQAIHYWGKGSKISRRKRSWYHHVSVWKYYLKHYPNGFSLFLLPFALGFNYMVRSLTGYDPS